jgi:hypothetical protein
MADSVSAAASKSSPITAKQASLMPRKKGPLCAAEFSPDNQGKQESTELNG